jgi:hypothetical protein
MFYEVEIPRPKPDQEKISALVVLNPAESRRLLAKAAVATPEVQNAMKKGMIIIGRGITNAYVSEELFNISAEPKAAQTSGIITDGIANVNLAPPPCTWHVVKDGKVMEDADSNEEIFNFGKGDVFIKGANAIDSQGIPGIYVASLKSGTIGMAWPIVTPRNCHLIIPVSLEKMVASVIDVSKQTGVYHYKYSMGIPFKLVPVPTAEVITEIQAFALMAGVKAYHIGSGGVGGSEGSVHLSLEGDEESIEKAFELAKSVKGEPPVAPSDKYGVKSPEDYDYDAIRQLESLGGV